MIKVLNNVSTKSLTGTLIKQDVGGRVVPRGVSRDLALIDAVVVEVVPLSIGQMPAEGRVVAAVHRPEVADAPVQIEHGPAVGLQRSGQERGQVQVGQPELDAFLQLQGSCRVIDKYKPCISGTTT